MLLTFVDQRTQTSEAVESCLQKALIFLTELGLTDKVFCKTALHRRRFTCCVSKPFILENQRLLSDSFLLDFRDLRRCGTVRQKFCSAKPTLWDFEACTLFQSAFGKIIYIQMLVKIIVILLLRCLKPFPLKFQRFSRELSVV